MHSRSDYEARLKKMKNDSFVFEPLFLDDHRSLQSNTCVIQLPSFMVNLCFNLIIDINPSFCEYAAKEGRAESHVPEKTPQIKQKNQSKSDKIPQAQDDRRLPPLRKAGKEQIFSYFSLLMSTHAHMPGYCLRSSSTRGSSRRVTESGWW